MYARAAKAYRQVDLESAPKTQILDRLYARFLRDLDDARAAMERNDIRERTKALNHAYRIVDELVAALDHQRAPELCANLVGLYRFVLDNLTEANTKASVESLDRASAVMTHLRDSFQQATGAR